MANEAVAAGASIVNDISGGHDPVMLRVVHDSGAGLVLMHMQGDPHTMQVEPHYDDVVAEVHEFLRERVEAAVFAGISADRLCVDPGIGFGKDLGHNLALLRAIEQALSPRGVFVVIEAEHLCMTMRGIKKPGAVTVTSAVRGLFRNDARTRHEAMTHIRMQ